MKMQNTSSDSNMTEDNEETVWKNSCKQNLRLDQGYI